MIRSLLVLTLTVLVAACGRADDPKPIKVLFLGDNGPHRPGDRFRQLQPVMEKRGIKLEYTDRADALNARTLAPYDALLIYANTTRISDEQEKALLEFVEGGKGFIPLHCASFCFHNSPKYIDLVGAQFKSHGTGTFRTTVAAPDHPIMKGFKGFESWDETYVHTKHNEKDRTVLEVRDERGTKEPWTWVRTQGKGRVFYTAWGHDQRTWGNAGFQDLVERGIRWAVGQGAAPVAFNDRPEMTKKRDDVKPFEYVEANVPFYPPGGRGARLDSALKKMQKPLPWEESVKHMVHPAGFELKLFVSEPQLGGKPIAMNWDERGRLWVALTVDYPNELKPAGSGRDRIVICEDTDNDGAADKVTEFADKLSIPTSLTFSRGGVIVHQAPHTLFLKDTDGDGKADRRDELLSGWSTGDTHAGPSNLNYGFDNWIYGIVGYAGYQSRVNGERVSFRSGFYRFKPDGSKIEFLRNTSNNSWGVGFSEDGLLFGSTANGCPSVFLAIPNRYYESVRGWSSSVLPSIIDSNRFQPVTDQVRQVDFHGGFTAAAGHALYTARAYPREYWNRTAFVNEPTGHLTATLVLQPDGTNFRARYGWNLVASDDEWTSPIVAEVGPDGNVWVIDWYNFIVQHNPTPPGFRTGKGAAYETELRDKKHGRIYRMIVKDAKPQPAVTLKDATPEKLVETLKNDNLFWRRHAQRLLVERDKQDVIAALVKLAGDESVDAIGLNPGVIHALWTMHGLGALDGSKAEATAAAVGALKHRSAGVRRNAALVLPRDKDGARSLLNTKALEDGDPQVRLAAFLALAEMPASSEAGEAIAAALRKSGNMDDRWLPDAITSAAAAHDLPFLRAVAGDKTALSGKALQVVTLIAEHHARGGPAATAGRLLESLGDSRPDVIEAVLAGLAKGWPRSTPAALDENAEKTMARLLTRVSPGGRGNLVRLASAWGSKALEKNAGEIARALMASVADEKVSEDERAAAARQLIALTPGDADTLKKVLDVVNARTPPALATAILEAAGSSTSGETGSAILERFGTWPPSARAAAVRTLLGRAESTRALLDAAEKGNFSLAELVLDQKQALSVHPDKKIAERAKALLAKGGGLPSADRQKVLEEFVALTKKSGDAGKGKEMFKKHCAACHSHTGEGNHIGPDLSGVAVHPKDHLLTDILDPSRNVEGNFRVYTVTTKDGLVLTGLLASETRTSLELIDSQAKKQVVQRADVEDLVLSTKSLMPEGFEKQLSREEMTDLLEFLAKRGKYLPLPLDRVATAVSTKGMFYDEKNLGERLVFPDWKPKTFEGVPFVLVDPQGDKAKNVILLHSPSGPVPAKMPKEVKLPCNAPAKAIHLLSGVSGWGHPYSSAGGVSMIVRLHYADGKTEDHELKDGEHFADYIRKVDVPGSKYAFNLGGKQIRYLAVQPKRTEKIAHIEFVKGTDRTAPIVMAVTIEPPE